MRQYWGKLLFMHWSIDAAALRPLIPDQLSIDDAVQHLHTNLDGKVVLTTQSKWTDTYDHVILATHGDEARRILGDEATSEEKNILDSFQTSKNIAVLHSDLSVWPSTHLQDSY